MRTEPQAIGAGDYSAAWMRPHPLGPAGCRAVQAAGPVPATAGRTKRPLHDESRTMRLPCWAQPPALERRRHDAAGAAPPRRARCRRAIARCDAPAARCGGPTRTMRDRGCQLACAARCRTPAAERSWAAAGGSRLPPCAAQHSIERHEAARPPQDAPHKRHDAAHHAARSRRTLAARCRLLALAGGAGFGV